MSNQDKLGRVNGTERDDDIISRCGSLSGETYVSQRSRTRDSSRATLTRQHKTDVLAKNLKEYHAQAVASLPTADNEPQKLRRLNSSFHHYRFVVVMMGGLMAGIMLLLRYNMAIAILRMVNQTHLYLEEHPNRTVDDFLAEGYALGGEFNWNNEMTAIILSWYMFTYTLPQTLMTKLSSMLGCRLAMPLSLATCALATIATPTLAYFGWQWTLACRLVNGLGASAIMPLMLMLIEKWMRYDEITLGLSMALVFDAGLTAVTPLFSGYLTEIHWSYAFYVPGAVALVFCIAWLVMITDEPETNWLMSERELAYIRECEPRERATTEEVTQHESSYKPDSWTQIFGVPSFYAYIIVWTFFCSSYSGFIFILPAYMRQFLKIRVAENGFYCFIIQLGCIISVIWPHHMLKLCARLGASQTLSHVICYAVCCSLTAATWIYVGLFHDSQLVFLFLNRAVHSANDVIVAGCLMSNYAKAGLSGIAFAMVNTMGQLSLVGTSTFYGWLLDYTGSSRQGWRYIFTSLGGSQILAFLIFATCIRAGPIKFRNKSKPMISEDKQKTEAGTRA